MSYNSEVTSISLRWLGRLLTGLLGSRKTK